MIKNRNIAADAAISLSKLEANGLLTTGKIFWVMGASDSRLSDFLKEHTSGTVFNTIDAAIGACTASRGDVIFVVPGYTETVTAAITMDVANVSIIGLGEGNQRPLITGNFAGDAVTMTAAGCRFENIRFAAPETDDQTADINIAAAGCVVRNTYHIGSQTSKNKTDVITVTAAGDDAIIEGVRVYNVTVDCVSAISLEGVADRVVIRNCIIQGNFSTAALMDEATCTLALIENNLIKNTKAATAVVDFSTGNSTGVMRFNHISGRHTTLASNVAAGTGMDFFENRVVEEAALNGAVIPAADTD